MANDVEIINHWGDLAALIDTGCDRTAKLSAGRILADTQEHVAVDTGELLKSGHIENPEPAVYEVVYGTDHCLFVEYGTRYMAAQPYMLPAMEREALRFAEIELLDVIGWRQSA